MKKRGKIIEVHFHLTNKWLYTFIALGILIILAVGVYAATTKTGGWHSSSEVEVTVAGVTKSLQEAINDGSLIGGGGASGTLGISENLTTSKLHRQHFLSNGQYSYDQYYPISSYSWNMSELKLYTVDFYTHYYNVSLGYHYFCALTGTYEDEPAKLANEPAEYKGCLCNAWPITTSGLPNPMEWKVSASRRSWDAVTGHCYCHFVCIG